MRITENQLRSIIRNVIRESNLLGDQGWSESSSMEPLMKGKLGNTERLRAIDFVEKYKEQNPHCSLEHMLHDIQFGKRKDLDGQTRRAILYFFRDAHANDNIDFEDV